MILYGHDDIVGSGGCPFPHYVRAVLFFPHTWHGGWRRLYGLALLVGHLRLCGM